MRTKFQVVMTRTQRGRDDDSISVATFEEGESYAIGADLFRAFVDEIGCAKPAPAKVETMEPPSSEPDSPAKTRQTKAKRRPRQTKKAI